MNESQSPQVLDGRFRKKPVVIDAYQLPASGQDVPPSFEQWCDKVGFEGYESGRDETLIIPTLEGDMIASPGDWIIKGVKGEFYPCKPDIFEASYERASTSRQPEAPTLTDLGIVYEQHEDWHTFQTPAFPGVYVTSKDLAKACADVLPSLAKLVELDTLASTEAPAETPSIVDAAEPSGPSSRPAGLPSTGASEVDELRRALAELLAAMMAEFPAAEAGKEAQEAWADRRAAARNRAQGWLSP